MKTTDIIMKEMRVSNGDDAERRYDIDAVVTTGAQGKVTGIREGRVRQRGAEPVKTEAAVPGNPYMPVVDGLAAFDGYGERVNVRFATAEGRADILAAIEEFEASVTEDGTIL